MNTKLNHIHDWPELAKQANWSVAAMAKQCGASTRTLERHFRKTMAMSPRVWLAQQRQLGAVEFLADGSSVKETASQLGYKYAHHFSRAFKKYWGCCPATQTASTKLVISACRVVV